MRILVVCGAGASSTFVAQRVRRAAEDRGIACESFAGTEHSLPVDLGSADIVLVGPHLSHALDRIHRDASARGAAVVLLPPDIFGDLDGSRTLALAQDALSATADPASVPVHD